MIDSRTEYVKKNILWANISNILLSIFSMISRTVFIYVLGVEYLGISGLFTNILGILSFANLGIGTAINFALYKPIAENDTEKVKSLLNLYRTAYRIIAIIILILGCLLLPFLKYLVKTDIPMSEIYVYYLLFLIDTVSTYFVSYKLSYVSAVQQNYVVNNVNMIVTIVTYVFQMAILLFVPSYLLYLINQIALGIISKFIIVIYLDKKYPILAEKDAKPLIQKDKSEIWKNVKALIIHKIGDAAVNQTDNIIVSAYIGSGTVGLVSNYIAIHSMINRFTNTLFNSFTSSFGNLIAKETVKKQREIFDIYDFVGFWIYGFVFVAFVTLSQPFVTLWLGSKMIIDNATMILFFLSMYLQGMTIITYNFKVAAGRFDEDKWVAFAQAGINLIVSIGAVKMIGLPGVYVGTIVQRLLVVIIRPCIVYKYVLKDNVVKYFKRFILRLFIIGGITLIMWWLQSRILVEITWLRFMGMTILTIIVPNLIILFIYGKTEMFKQIVTRFIKKGKV